MVNGGPAGVPVGRAGELEAKFSDGPMFVVPSEFASDGVGDRR